MKHLRTAALIAAISLVLALCGAAVAAETYVPHAERIVRLGDKLYGLVAYRAGAKYSASRVIELDASLEPARSVDLIDGTEVGMNANDMIVYDGKLYVTCIGGWQTVDGTQGSVWEVDASGAAMSARMIADTATHPYFKSLTNAQIYGISAAPDGTFFIPIQTSGYRTPGDSSTYYATGKIMIANVASLSADRSLGNVSIDLGAVDYPFAAMWQEDQGVLWVDHSGTLKGFTKAGAPIAGATVSERSLGARLYEFAPLPALGGIVYAACNYSGEAAGATAMGTVVSGEAGVTATKTFSGATVTDLGIYTYKSAGGEDRVMLLERSSGSSNRDRVFVWNGTAGLANAPDINKAIEVENTHGVTAMGDSLYMAAYENPRDGNSGPGEFVKLSMADYAKTAGYALPSVRMADSAKNIPSSHLAALGLAGVSTDMTIASIATPAEMTERASEIQASDLEVAGGVVTISEAAAKRIADGMRSRLGYESGAEVSISALGAFKASSMAGGRIAVEYELTGAQLLASRPSDVKIVKVLSSSDASRNRLFEHVESGTEAADKDGAFMVVSSRYSAVTTITPSASYRLILIIKDDGTFDLDKDPKSVIDPSFIVKASGGGSTGGGGGGGCTAGAGIAIAAIALLISKKR